MWLQPGMAAPALKLLSHLLRFMVALRPGQPPSSVLIASCQGSWPPPCVLEKALVKAIEHFRRKQGPAAASVSHPRQGASLTIEGSSERHISPLTPIPNPYHIWVSVGDFRGLGGAPVNGITNKLHATQPLPALHLSTVHMA